MEVILEPNPCICGDATGGTVLFECEDHNFHATDQTSTFVRCPTCRSLRPAEFPTDATLGNAYRQYYTTGEGSNAPSLARRILDLVGGERLRRYALRDLPDGARSVLDFGCGSGAYLQAAKTARPALSAYGTDVLKSDRFPAQEMAWVDGDDLPALPPVDYVTMGHVLEHLRDPVGTIGQLALRIAPGGSLWIATPNADSFLIRSFGRWARDVDFPRHHLIFSRERLTKVLIDNGFEAVTFRAPPRVNALMNMVQCLGNLWRDPRAKPVRKLATTARALFALAIFLCKPAGIRTAADQEIVASATRLRTG